MENKSSFKKKIAAVLASILLMFSKASANTNAIPTLPNDTPVAEKELNIKSFSSLAKNYKDVGAISEDIIPLDEILSTHIRGEVCDTMVPQGLAVSKDFILMTAYDGIEGYKTELRLHSYNAKYNQELREEQNHEVHNSVIYILDRKTHEIITTLELPDLNHVGGIATDDENVYIAKSSDGEISVISLERIKRAVERARQEGTKAQRMFYEKKLRCNCDASFITIREEDGKKQFVIGTWTPLPGNSTLRIFEMDENQELDQVQKLSVCSSANGAKFVKRGDKEYLVVASSISRNIDSRLYVYEVEKDEKGKMEFTLRSKFILPPMLEEIDEIEDENGERKLLIGTEIFSKRYEIGRQSVYPTGIIVANLDSILDRETREEEKSKTDKSSQEFIVPSPAKKEDEEDEIEK